MGRSRKIFILAFALLASSCYLHGRQADSTMFETRHLKSLYKLLQLPEMPESDITTSVTKITSGKEVTFEFNGKQQLSHLGISLFSPETKSTFGRDICNFIERLFLELSLQPNADRVKSKLAEYDISLNYCGQEFGSGLFKSIGNALHEIDSRTDFTLQTKEKKGVAAWSFGNGSMKIIFPLQRELVEGTDKKESDEKICEQLRKAINEPADLHDDLPGNPQLRQDGLYVAKGVTNMVQSLSSDRYYVKKPGGFDPLYSEKYPEYSMNNLFLTFKYGKGKSMLITHRQYGHSTPTVQIPLNSFLSCFRDDFQTTCHTAYNDEEELESVVVLQHKTLNYIHMLKVRTSKEELFKTSSVFKAEFYTNIPQHYIKTLLQ